MNDQDSLFRKSVTRVTPLRNQDSRSISNRPSSHTSLPEVTPATGSGKIELDGDLFYRNGIQKKRLRDLRRGRLKITDTLDLHGYTRTSAPTTITSFIASCSGHYNHCVMIITGKGRNSPDSVPVVRETTLEILRNHPRVLAYCCSQPVDGGHGAFYVLLQR